MKETLLVRALSYQPVTLQNVEQVVAEQLLLALDQVDRGGVRFESSAASSADLKTHGERVSVTRTPLNTLV